MASARTLSAGILLLIVCGTQLSLTAPVDEPSDDIYKDAETPDEEPDVPNTPTEKSETPLDSMSSNVTLTASTSFSQTTLLVTSAATNGTSNSTNSTENMSAIVSTTASPNANSTILEEQDAKTAETETGNTTNGPSVKPADDEYHFWWSDSTWMSIAVPVIVGLGSAVLLISWICCMRWCCCRHRYRSPPYKAKVKVDRGPSKKTLREDFRQLRQRDRMKLLAESSDEEF